MDGCLNRVSPKSPSLARLFFQVNRETKRKVASYYTSKDNSGHFGSTCCHVTLTSQRAEQHTKRWHARLTDIKWHRWVICRWGNKITSQLLHFKNKIIDAHILIVQVLFICITINFLQKYQHWKWSSFLKTLRYCKHFIDSNPPFKIYVALKQLTSLRFQN